MKTAIRLLALFSIVVHSRQNQVKKIVTEGVETSSFSCEGRVSGYYADIETGCRTYHYCIGNNQYSYACPNNTLFQQRIFICNHWYLVECEKSEQDYKANLLIGQRDKPFVGVDENVFASAGISRVIFSTTTKPPLPVTRNYTDAVHRKEPITFGEDIQRVEQETTKRIPPPLPTKPASRTGKATAATVEAIANELIATSVESDEDDSRFIRLSVTDPRELFFIPNDDDSTEIARSRSYHREFLIPKYVNHFGILMRFKESRAERGGDVPCPRYCHPRFLKPGTCHPCIMINSALVLAAILFLPCSHA